MTSQVKIVAHCSKDKQVEIKVSNDPCVPNGENVFYINDGESFELSVYDDKSVTVREVLKNE